MNRVRNIPFIPLQAKEITRLKARLGEMIIDEPGWVKCAHSPQRHDALLIENSYRALLELENVRENAEPNFQC